MSLKRDEWTRDEIELLIYEVQSQACLYDLNCEKYKDKKHTNAAWKVISNNLNKTITSCREKWKVLRTQKRRLYSETQKIKSESGRMPYIRWEYYKPLNYLEPHFTMEIKNEGPSEEPNAAQIDELMIKYLSQEPDPNQHFLKELGIQLATLPMIVQYETKIEIQQLVLEKMKQVL